MGSLGSTAPPHPLLAAPDALVDISLAAPDSPAPVSPLSAPSSPAVQLPARTLRRLGRSHSIDASFSQQHDDEVLGGLLSTGASQHVSTPRKGLGRRILLGALVFSLFLLPNPQGEALPLTPPVIRVSGSRSKIAPLPPPPFCPNDLHGPATPNASFATTLCDGGAVPVPVSVPSWALARVPHSFVSDTAADPRTWPAHAQWGEDTFALRELFFGVSGGLIVESGALDGDMFSTSFGFVHAAGWRAVHVEMNPRNYASLFRNRPESLNFHCGICDASQSLHFVNDTIDPTGLSGVSGFWEFMSPALKAQWYKDVKEEKVLALPATPCRTLSSLLTAFGIDRVDLWVLDVEGAEASVLQSFNFSAVHVDVVLIELDGSNSLKDDAARAVLAGAGFHLHRRGHPHPFYTPDDKPQTFNQDESRIGLDNEWWLHADFTISFEAAWHWELGDRSWLPSRQQYFIKDEGRAGGDVRRYPPVGVVPLPEVLLSRPPQ